MGNPFAPLRGSGRPAAAPVDAYPLRFGAAVQELGVNLHCATARDHHAGGTAAPRGADTAPNPAGLLTKLLEPTKTAQHREAVGVRAPHPDIQITTLTRDAAAGARAATHRL